MKIYLHETVDVVSGKWEEYQQGIFDVGMAAIADYGLGLVSFNQVKYSSGRWPEAVAIWEIESWERYASEMKELMIGDAPPDDHPVGKYMMLAPKWRTGGFDRILTPVPFSPEPPAGYKLGGGVKSPQAIFLQQSYMVRPGESGKFLDAVENGVLPATAAAGVTLEAFWSNSFDPLEYIGLWSLPDLDAFVRHKQRRDPADEGTQLPGLGATWSHLTALSERMLLPTTYSPLGGGEKSWASPM